MKVEGCLRAGRVLSQAAVEASSTDAVAWEIGLWALRLLGTSNPTNDPFPSPSGKIAMQTRRDATFHLLGRLCTSVSFVILKHSLVRYESSLFTSARRGILAKR